MHYRLFFLILLLVLLISCSNGTQQSKDYEIIYNGQESLSDSQKISESSSYTVAVIPKVSGIPYFNAAKAGALEAGKDLGIEVLYEGSLSADWKKQSELIREFTEKSVDAIAVSATDPEKLGPVLLEAREQGIKVITWDSDTDPKYRELYINMVDPETLGRHVMDTLAARMGEKGKFAILTDSGEAANTKEWINWMRMQQSEYYPDMTLVDILKTDDNPNKAYMAAKELLNEHPDLKGIIGSSSVGPPAAAQAVEDINKTEEVTVVGLSTPNLMRTYIKEGAAEIVTLWSPKRLGYLTVSIAKQLLDDKQLTDNQAVPNIGVVRVKGDTVIMGRPIDFTKENIDEYDF